VPEPRSARPSLLSRGSWPETQRIAAILRQETIGGVLLLIAAVAALIWANAASSSYEAARDFRFGPSALHLDLTVGQWAADGLLAIFFFVAGLELKREFVAGDLRSPQRAAVPVIAAIGGMAVPALIYVAFTLGTGDGALKGWAIPTATDIAFALAVLAVIGSHLPAALRTFLLTLAVVDDLLAITIIALFFTSGLSLVPLALGVISVALFGFLVQRRITAWWVLLPVAALAWGLVHASGVHATVAGVALAFTVPVRHEDADEGGARAPGMAERLEHRIRPISAGLAVPVFAFFAAGVTIGGFSGLGESLTDRVAVGIIAGLVAGKAVGILAATWLTARFTRAELDPDLRWIDMAGVALLGGIGFTVSLLIGELAFGIGSVRDEHVKVGVLAASVLAAVLAAVLLGSRNRVYKRVEAQEALDSDGDGVPDAYQRGQSG
jgi:NhaA family Na+:H+ antiporter